MQRNLIFFLVVMCFSILSIKAQKNDTIYLRNGDRITGELKKFEYGLLDLKTDAMQTINIEFDEINSIHSSKYFEIRMKSGDKFFGTLRKSDVLSTVDVLTISDTLPKRLWDIILIMPIKRNFIQKIDGSLDLGLSYTKASDVFQYSLNFNFTHRTNYYATRFELESIVTDDGEKKTNNSTLGLDITHYLPNKWFTSIIAQGQQNTELNLDYRLQAGYGVGYDITRTNFIRFYALGGLLVNQEHTIDLDEISQNIEALIKLKLKWFKYRHPKVDVTSNFNTYTSITSFGRVRLEYNISSKFEVVKDLYLNLQLYDYFDNETSDGSKANNDWGIVTSIGFTF
ncbi:MAG TPA: DUF481 domain-containing protein [Flavobacterium sp.]|nr:DUF481 domain-containing protein [Flavobacterium sp.]